ncbi:hypothetical protein BX598_1856 [Micrococcaceae bacterium JKS001869]|nr:hypothetical protein BX598_1856 [Micrococcaceae bacterium JKS001869]
MAENPEDLIVTDAELRRQLPALAKELKIGGGSGIEQVSGTVSLDASGAPIREFFTTGATTFNANGTTTPLGAYTAVVWRRTSQGSQGSWGYQVVQDGWTTPTPTPDTTAPVAGTLTVTVTDVKADLTVSGASDDRGYVQYSFSKDNGSTWTGYQDGSTYTFTGLTASTAYTFKHRVKDGAGNPAIGAAVSKTTEAAPSALADSIKALAPVGYWKLNETSGAVAADSSGNGRHGSYSKAYTSVGGYVSGSPVVIPDADAFSPHDSTDGFTVFVLARPAQLSPRGFLVAKGDVGQYEWWIDSVNGAIRFTASTLAGDPLIEYASKAPVITTGAWNAVVAASAQPVSGGSAELFHNSSTPLETTKTTPVAGSSANGTNPVTIGIRSTATPLWGQYAHVAIFRKKLTSAEIGGLMDAARTEGLIA